MTVTATAGTFRLGPAQATATLVVQRGRLQEARDSSAVQLDPAIGVTLDDTAMLLEGGGAVSIGVSVACAPGPTGLESYVAVSQGSVIGRGFYVPICDGTPHTFTVTATRAQGAFRVGDARALSFADGAWNGSFFSGVADEPLQLVS